MIEIRLILNMALSNTRTGNFVFHCLISIYLNGYSFIFVQITHSTFRYLTDPILSLCSVEYFGSGVHRSEPSQPI